MNVAREEILGRIRAAQGGGSASGGAVAHTIPRSYRHNDGRAPEELIALFCERMDDYRAEVERIRPDRLLDAIAAAASRHEARRLVIPSGLPDDWRPPGLELIPDHLLTARELDGLDGVVTGCTVAIAETGTIVLTSGPHEGRRAVSLVPDLHICLVHARQVVGTVPEAVSQLEPLVRDARRPITLISGPSATSDIELQRVEGVHGPRRLVVLLIDEPLVDTDTGRSVDQT